MPAIERRRHTFVAKGKAGSSRLVIPCRELQAERPWFIDESGEIVEIDCAGEITYGAEILDRHCFNLSSIWGVDEYTRLLNSRAALGQYQPLSVSPGERLLSARSGRLKPSNGSSFV
jgi:hypothetical protein